MSDSYCNRHGTYKEDIYGCPDCRRADEAAVEAREEAERAAEERAERAEEAAQERADRAEELKRELAEEHIYRLNNPGEFKCPGCMLITLMRGARRCPKCQFDVPGEYWQQVEAAEAAERKKREEAIIRERETKERERVAQEEWLRSPEGIAHTLKARNAEAAAADARNVQREAEALSERARELAATSKKLFKWYWISVIPLGIVGSILSMADAGKIVAGVLALLWNLVWLGSIVFAVRAIILFMKCSDRRGMGFMFVVLGISVMPLVFLLLMLANR